MNCSLNKRVHRSRRCAKTAPASALLIALLLMGFLAVFGVGMSRLVVRSIRVERNVVEAGKAYFAAESGVERALYAEENFLPGYELEEEVTLTNGAIFSYRLRAQDAKVPCFVEEDVVPWRPLQVQESVSLPLFRADSSGVRKDLEDFKVEFAVNRGELSRAVSGDALRWKILGLTSAGRTESVSGLLPYDHSVAFGIDAFDSNDGANFYESLSEGRFYNWNSYPIKEFLAHHDFNYLILTNVIAPEVQSSLTNQPELLPENNRLNVRLTTTEGILACEVVLIESDGASGGTEQSLDTRMARDSSLPVFDFALYQVK